MNTEHLFISSPSAPTPDRWREAFPAGQTLDAASLVVLLRGKTSAQCMLWLSSADAQWQVYLRQILQAIPGARVVLLSNAPEPQEGLIAFDQGVRGYTHAYSVPALLQEVALVVAHDGLWMGADLMRRLVSSTSTALTNLPVAQRNAVNAWSLLSAREIQVARAVSKGCSNKEIAAQMFISERTVKAHLGAMFEKLGVRDRLQLVLRLSASSESAP
jgi:DNA-binding NarL/FixJ family response regulator